MYMHRTELVSMIKIVSLLGFHHLLRRCNVPMLCLCHGLHRLKYPLPSSERSHLRFCTPKVAKMGKRTERAIMETRLTELENIVAAQMQEMELVRQKVYELERNQIQIKQRYAL